MLTHSRRVFSCHGAGAVELRRAHLGRGLVQGLDCVAFERDGTVCRKSDGSPLFRTATAASADSCAGVGSDACGSLPPAVRLTGPVDHPEKPRALAVLPFLDGALASVSTDLSWALLTVEREGSVVVEISHVRGGRGTVRLEFFWHHRCYVSARDCAGFPDEARRKILQAIETAAEGGIALDP